VDWRETGKLEEEDEVCSFYLIPGHFSISTATVLSAVTLSVSNSSSPQSIVFPHT